MSREPVVYKAPPILAITIPLACTVISMAWAIASYLMVREKYRAQVEPTHLGVGKKKPSTFDVLGSIAWAVAVSLIMREQYRAQVELARIEMEGKKLSE